MAVDEEVLRKLDQIESRLSRLENRTNEKKIIKEDRIEIAEDGKLESSELSKENGTVKVKRVPVCNHCGHKLGELFSACKKCGNMLDEKCSIEFRNQVRCPNCLQLTNPLTRPAFKVLLCYANDITDNSDLHRVTGIPKKEVRDIVQFLLGVGYLEDHIFRGNSVSEKGREVLFAYSQLWGGMGDMQQLDEEIKRFVFEQ